jgi:uncharacterized protein
MQTSAPALAPTPATERIVALDTLRGFAVLGILLMNILAFGLPEPAYMVPTAEVGGATGPNLWAWIAEMFYFEGTMRGLFTLLFGAGVVLYTSRLERAGLGVRVADYYFRRNLWLIVFGLANAYLLLWQGDVLFFYGLTGLFLFVFRQLSVRALLVCALLFGSVPTIRGIQTYQSYVSLEAEAPALVAREAAKKLSEDDQAKLERYRRLTSISQADPVAAKTAITAMRGSFGAAFDFMAPNAWRAQTQGFWRFIFWETMGMMLLGMALFKTGFLSLGWSTRSYLVALALGYGVGLGINALEIRHILANDFSSRSVLLSWALTYDLGRIPATLGHVALVMLMLRGGARSLLAPLAAAGQMALTNYLTQSLICLLLFTGVGAGWFGQLQRYQLYYVVAAIWAVQLAWSPWWLARFQFGPVEWLWRSLTRWERQGMRKGVGGSAVPAS